MPRSPYRMEQHSILNAARMIRIIVNREFQIYDRRRRPCIREYKKKIDETTKL